MIDDRIGRDKIINKILNMVDSLQENQNICIAINGRWGSGKTFLLDMLNSQLKNHDKYIVFRYDAWENSYYSDPLIAILSCIVDTLEIKGSDKISDKIKNTLKAVFHSGVRCIQDKKIQEVIRGIMAVIGSLTTKNENHDVSEFKSYQTLLGEIKSQLNSLTSDNNGIKKLVIVVDEIDRCIPNEQLKILEKLHHLFNINNCVVIVALNQECVANTIKTIYGVDGDEYLQKFFNITYELETSSKQYFESILQEFYNNIKRLNSNIRDLESIINIAYNIIANGKQSKLNSVNNRVLNTYMRALNNICDKFGWERLDQSDILFVILGLYIRMNINKEFLNPDNIELKQEKLNEDTLSKKSNNLPFYDYIEDYFGILTKISPYLMPKELKKYDDILQIIYHFNEMVYYSCHESLLNNYMRQLQGSYKVYSEDYKKLSELIISYGGDSESARL